MSESATQFLTHLAKTVSSMSLYEEGHPARERSVDGVLEAILRLQEEVPKPEFTFVGNEIVFQGRPLHSLKRWGWGARLGGVGVQRLEFTGPVTRDDLEVFLYDVQARLTGVFISTAETRQTRPTVIQYGIVGVKGQGRRLEDGDEPLSANVRETRSTQRIRVGRRQRKRTCWDCEREWKRMVMPLEPGRPSEARQLLRTQR